MYVVKSLVYHSTVHKNGDICSCKMDVIKRFYLFMESQEYKTTVRHKVRDIFLASSLWPYENIYARCGAQRDEFCRFGCGHITCYSARSLASGHVFTYMERYITSTLLTSRHFITCP